jgi:hypothetical protein
MFKTLITAAITISVILFSSFSFCQDAPKVVTTPEGKAPSDAIVLFDGSSLSEWTYADGKPAGWDIKDGAMIVKGGGIVTKKEFGDFQLHLEFASPSPAKGTGQDRGNSGVYLHGIYEVQVLDCFNNETYFDGMLGAVYKQYPPLVNVCREPGVWQTYDFIFHAPKFDSYGSKTTKSIVTVIINGVLVQDHVEIAATPGGVRDKEAAKGPIFLQDHNHPVKFRNIWIREL